VAARLRVDPVLLERADDVVHGGHELLLADVHARPAQRVVGRGHLLDRIYGTRVALALASDPDAALAEVHEAEEAVRGPLETCPGCRITFAVPAAVAAARARDIDL